MATSTQKSSLSPQSRQAFGIKDGNTTAKGLEKAIFIAGDAVIKAQFAINDVFYGKYQADTSASKFQKALDKGVVNIVEELVSIDLCQILNIAINKVQIPGSSQFDPKADPPTNPLAISKYKIQKAAYDTQLKLDGFYSSYSELDTSDNKAKLVYEVIQQIKDAFSEINDEQAQSALRDPRLLQAFPQLGSVNSFLEKAFTNFNRYTDYRQIPAAEIQNLVNRIDKIRGFLIIIQGLNSPAALLNFADTVFPNANIQEQIQKLQALIDINRISPFLRNLIQSLKKIQSVCNVFASFIGFGQFIITIATLVLKAFGIIIKFLKKLPIPNLYTTTGITTEFADFLNKLETKRKDLINRLSQINTLLSLTISLVSQILIILFDLIRNLTSLLTSLEACNNIDPNIVEDLRKEIQGLEKTANTFKNFVDNYNNNKVTSNNTFGDYTISIITEEVVDDSISLRRRYGVALGKNGAIATQSTPTFASDDQIIINEVKVQLISLKLVQTGFSAIDSGDMAIIMESLNFVQGNEIDINDFETDSFSSGLDSPNNENENDGLGLNAFANKLPGGKKLRERMRKSLKENANQLRTDLAENNPRR